jgi:hydrogenase nickel incorporation protein HypA/HybF
MHEVSLMEATLEIALAQARQHRAQRIHALKLRVGEQSGVVPEALRFAFDIVVAGTLAEGASLEIESVPVRCYCPRCSQDFGPPSWIYACPQCGELSTQVLAGKELELTSLELS